MTSHQNHEHPVKKTTFYYPHPRQGAPGETLVFMANIWSESEIAEGELEVTPKHRDYQLWCWICDRSERFTRITSDDLPAIREEFRQWQSGKKQS